MKRANLDVQCASFECCIFNRWLFPLHNKLSGLTTILKWWLDEMRWQTLIMHLSWAILFYHIFSINLHFLIVTNGKLKYKQQWVDQSWFLSYRCHRMLYDFILFISQFHYKFNNRSVSVLVQKFLFHWKSCHSPSIFYIGADERRFEFQHECNQFNFWPIIWLHDIANYLENKNKQKTLSKVSITLMFYKML